MDKKNSIKGAIKTRTGYSSQLIVVLELGTWLEMFWFFKRKFKIRKNSLDFRAKYLLLVALRDKFIFGFKLL